MGTVSVLVVATVVTMVSVLSNPQQGQRFSVVPDTVNVTQGGDVTLRCQVEN